MIAVIFEVEPADGERDAYFSLATEMKPLLSTVDGFISVERFQSLADPGKILSLSFWRDEAAVAAWRRSGPHRGAQIEGRSLIFRDYRLRVAHVLRDYGMSERRQAPQDSRRLHDRQGEGAGDAPAPRGGDT